MAFSGAATGTPVPGNVATDDGRRPTGQPAVSSTAAQASDVLAALQPSACLGHRSSATEAVFRQLPGCALDPPSACGRTPTPRAGPSLGQMLELPGSRAQARQEEAWSCTPVARRQLPHLPGVRGPPILCAASSCDGAFAIAMLTFAHVVVDST